MSKPYFDLLLFSSSCTATACHSNQTDFLQWNLSLWWNDQDFIIIQSQRFVCNLQKLAILPQSLESLRELLNLKNSSCKERSMKFYLKNRSTQRVTGSKVPSYAFMKAFYPLPASWQQRLQAQNLSEPSLTFNLSWNNSNQQVCFDSLCLAVRRYDKLTEL